MAEMVEYDDLPSIFEILAQERLMMALRQALHHILTVAAERHPRLLLRLHHFREEVYLALNGLLEAHSLRVHASSFGEHFYNLYRVPLNAPAVESSSKVHPSRSLVAYLLLLLPVYVRAKLDSVLGIDAETENEARRVSTRLRLARIVYRTICGLCDVQHLMQLILYLFRRSPYASFSQRLLGYSLRRMNMRDGRMHPKSLLATQASTACSSFLMSPCLVRAGASRLSAIRYPNTSYTYLCRAASSR